MLVFTGVSFFPLPVSKTKSPIEWDDNRVGSNFRPWKGDTGALRCLKPRLAALDAVGKQRRMGRELSWSRWMGAEPPCLKRENVRKLGGKKIHF